MAGFVHSERVRFGDLDAMRHLNDVVFLRYFETARISYLRHLIPGHDLDHQGRSRSPSGSVSWPGGTDR